MVRLLFDENFNHRILRGLRLLPKYAYERLEAGQPLPGLVIIPKQLPIGSAIEELAILLACSQPDEFPNRIIHLPL